MASIRDDVIQTKLTAPSLPLRLISRARLHALLDEHAARLVLVSAPAGFGKTALLLDWLDQQSLPIAWLSVDRHDNDPERFFCHLSATIAALPVSGAQRVAALVRTLAHRTGPVPEVQEALAALSGDAVIVLDDVHEVEEPNVVSALQQLLEPRRSGPRLVLLTRVDPPFSLGRLRVSGELLEVRERDLRFTRDECVALFDSIRPGGLDLSLVTLLEQRTEGWAAGLRMAAIALQDSADPAAAVAAFAGSHRIVVDYLVEEAFEKQSEEVQRFLLDTSVLERFTPETCTVVTHNPDAPALLSQVEAASLFLVPLGADRHWYRYHHLFRELLEFRLRRLHPQRVEVLNARAAAWFEQAGDIHAAIEHACQLDDRTILMQLLDTHSMSILARSEIATLERWLARVPAPLSQAYPLLIVTIGWLRILTDRVPDLAPVLVAADAALARVEADYDNSRKWRARVQLDVLRGFAARFAGHLEEALEISRAVLADLPADEAFTRGLVVYNQARLHMVLGEMHPAAQLLHEASKHNQCAANLYLVLTGLGHAATVCAQLEGVYRARQRLDTALAFAEQRYLTGLPAFSSVLYHLGNVAYLADRLDEAHAAGEQATALAGASNFPEGHANGLLLLARVAAARRQFAEADGLLIELAALAQNRNVLLLDTTVALEQKRFSLLREQCGAGPPVARLAPAAHDTRWTTSRETELLLCLHQALRVQDYDAATLLSETLHRESESRGRGVALCLALLADALLPANANRWPVLDQALTMAAVRGYMRPLLDYGELLRSVLQAAPARSMSVEARAHARLLLERLDRTAAPPQVPSLIEPLTPREEQVLQYLGEKLSNKGIARSMYVSAETVKTHLKHLYGKLGAANRSEALARARELGLQPRSR